MAKFIEDAIHKLEGIVHHGKYKLKKRKLKTDVAKKVAKEVSNIIDDNIPREERKEICDKAGKEAHKPVADMKRKVSNDVRKDLGLD